MQNVRYTPLGAYQSITIRFQALLTLCQEFFSAFPHGTLFAIGLDLYLGLEVDVPQIRASFPRHVTQEHAILHTSSVYGAFTLYGITFQKISTWMYGQFCGLNNTTSQPHYYGRFSLPLSAFTRCYLQNLN